MMEKNLKWNKPQNLDDENQKNNSQYRILIYEYILR